MAGVAAADRGALEPEVGEHPRARPGWGGRRACRWSPPTMPASSGTAARSSAVVAGPAARRASVASRAASSQASPSGAIPAPAIALAIRLRSDGRDPRRRTAPGRRQQVAGEDEERAPHGELLHDRRVVVERGVDVGGVTPSDRAATARWTVAASVACSTVIARVTASTLSSRCAGDSAWRTAIRFRRSASLTVSHRGRCPGGGQSRWDLPGRSSIRCSATSASASVSGSTVIWLTTWPATRFSSAHTRCGRSMRFIVEQ